MELGFRTALAQMIVSDMEIFSGRCGRFRLRLVNVQPFHYHIIGQVIFLSRINGLRFGCKLGLDGFRFLFQTLADNRDRLHPENRKASGVCKGHILQLHPANIRLQLADLEGAPIQLKGSFPRNQVLTGILRVTQFCRCRMQNCLYLFPQSRSVPQFRTVNLFVNLFPGFKSQRITACVTENKVFP